MAWLYKRGGVWWVGYRQNGRQVLRSTKTSDKETAEREIAKLEAMRQAHKAGTLTEEFFRLLTNRAAAVHTLGDTVKLWFEECKDNSPRTLRQYRDGMKEFVLHLGSDVLPLRDIRTETIRRFLRAKRAATSTTTANQSRKVLNTFFNFAVDTEAITHSPMPSAKSLKLAKDTRSGRRPFTLKELQTVFAKCPNDFWRYMVIGGFYTALRMGDLITLPWGAVDFPGNVIRLRTRKTGTAMNIPIRRELGELLKKRKREAGEVKPSDYVWPEQALKYEEHGPGPFSNEFYHSVLLPAGLVTKRAKHAERDAEGNPIVKRSRKTNEISFHCLRHT
ncbi:MAG TPA: tyrosine-type recombinase/integrase, partial [Verrucomicrobiae bacterium]|nr:tyrosine-type recombinase/integrase [Verrucomicrobiae bacterium]